MDDPAADYAIIPTWFLARRARQDVKVVLCGEGGDEIFAGYGRYRSAMRPWWLGGRVDAGARQLRPAGRAARARRPAGATASPRPRPAAADGGRSRLAAAQATDIADWLPHDLLLKLDRCLMAHGVEGRTPFLDPGVARGGVPAAGRAEGARRARASGSCASGWSSTCRRRGRSRRSRASPCRSAPGSRRRARGSARWSRRSRAWRRSPSRTGWRRCSAHAAGGGTGFAAWKLLFYALWHRRHMLGLPPAGDVFETLATL